MDRAFIQLLVKLEYAVVACICAVFLRTNAVAGGTGEDNLTWTLDDAGTLTISGIGPMRDYLTIGITPWESYRYDIKEIVISDGVTTIGSAAFDGRNGLTSVTIPESPPSNGVLLTTVPN